MSGENEFVEAVVPKVRIGVLSERIDELEQAGRPYRVLDLPNLTADDREQIALEARHFVGRRYDLLNCVWYAFRGLWVEDGTKRLICSRLVTAAYRNGAGIDLFMRTALAAHPEVSAERVENLIDGYCTPEELLDYSRLVAVEEVVATVAA